MKENIIINAGNSGTFARLLCGLVAKRDGAIKLLGDKNFPKEIFQE